MSVDTAKTVINETLRGGAKACVFFSGGIDSLLVLYLTREFDLPVVTFAADWSRDAMKKLEKIVADWELTLYTFPPRARYALPVGNGLALVDEYRFGGRDLPVIRDISGDSTKCLGDLSPTRFDDFDFGFDTIFVGALESDSHEATGPTWFRRERSMDNLRFIAPLFDWTKAEVRRVVDDLNLSDYVIENTGDIDVCCRCLKSDTFCPAEQKHIPAAVWNKSEVTAFFYGKYGLETI